MGRMIDIDKRKQEILWNLKEIELECLILLDRIPAWREALEKIKDVNDAAVFDETFDLEAGLKHIQLF